MMHGRGFAAGAGSEPWYDGTNLSRRGDAVVVTVNHRLNLFGYLHLAELGGDDYAGSGVAGMLDVLLALEWLRDNASRFGGDPSNVTVFGESGGGVKVSTLLGMPSARGLFHRAVIQSGPGLRGVEPHDATSLAEALLAKLEISGGDLSKLSSVPAQDLLRAANALPGRPPGSGPMLLGGGTGLTRFAPVVDGGSYPRHPFHPDAAPTAAEIPVLIGTNRDEAALFLAADPRRRRLDETELLKRLHRMLGERAEPILEVYRRTRPGASPWDLLIAIASEPMRLASVRLAERKAAAGGAPVYMYLFTWQSDHMGGLFKAGHALELPFVFDNVDQVPITGKRVDRHQLASSVSEAWIAFARTGSPGHAGIPAWPRYTETERDTLVFDVPCRLERDPGRRELDSWQGVDLRR